MWNRSSRSVMSAEAIVEACGMQLIRQCATRWNSVFDATERLVRIVEEKGEDAIHTVCLKLNVPRLKTVEINFLKEYTNTMRPLAKALDLLQCENKAYMGFLLPTLYQLQGKLRRKRDSAQACEPLINVLLAGIARRFADVLRDPELVAATILHPRFKKTWTDDLELLESGMRYIRRNLEMATPAADEEADNEDDDDDGFFARPVRHTTSQLQLEQYLASTGHQLPMLSASPLVKALFVRTNTALPASAACERLFSAAGRIFTPLRARIGDDGFENQLLLKHNARFL